MGKLRSIKPGGPIFRPKPPIRTNIISPNPNLFNRQASVKPVRGASLNRVVAREVRRNAFHQAANQMQTQPRFIVRPATPPLKIMPKIPLPVQSIKRPSPVRPIAPPATVTKITLKPASRPTPQPTQVVKNAGKAPVSSTVLHYQRPGAVIRPVTAAIGTAGIAALMINAAAANPQISSEANTLNSSLEDLKTRSSLQHIIDEINRLDTDLTHALDLLESARKEGYVYQKDLDEIAYQVMGQWQGIKQGLLDSIPQQASAFQNKMLPLGVQLARLNSVLGNPTSATHLIGDTSSQLNKLSSELYQVETSLENRFTEINNQATVITSRLNLVHWSMDQVSQAKFNLEEAENLIIAVQARWDQEGDKDPEGILYLTNKRIIFERKEKVATKKILFIATARELVQEVLIDQKLENIKDVKAIHKGLFGNQDFLEIQFSDVKLSNVPFHVNGQDCNEWTSWIQKAKSSEIENERTTGSGLSFADLTGPLTTVDLLALQTEVNSLQDVVTLKPVHEELGKIENDMRDLERNLVGLRARGYVIEKNLEADITILATQWDRIKTNAEIALQSQTKLLGEQMNSIQQNMSNLAGKSSILNESRPLYMQIKSAIASTEAQADAADDAVIATYDQYADEVESMSAHMEWVGWMLDALSSASFQLMATESGIAATEAVWYKPGLDPENGILFLTDQRLLWEDRVDTFELKVNQPIKQITGVKSEVDEISKEEALVFEMDNSSSYPIIRFLLTLPVAEAWVKMFGRARSGEYAKDRAVGIDPTELERLRNAPRQCPNCGAGFTAPILRGQTDIPCEYCGQVTRI